MRLCWLQIATLQLYGYFALQCCWKLREVVGIRYVFHSGRRRDDTGKRSKHRAQDST